jgi:hypothetical protein
LVVKSAFSPFHSFFNLHSFRLGGLLVLSQSPANAY